MKPGGVGSLSCLKTNYSPTKPKQDGMAVVAVVAMCYVVAMLVKCALNSK